MKKAFLILTLFGLVLASVVVWLSYVKESQYEVLMVGTTSTPEYEKVIEGRELIGTGRYLAVFGHGTNAGEIWGELTFRYDDGESITYTKGGLIAWTEPEGRFEAIYGEAQVELVVYLLDAKANQRLQPSAMFVKKKWKVPVGTFTLDLED